MNILSPSILAADFWTLGEQINAVRDAGATYLHVDVMDGLFVPSISFGLPVLKSIRTHTQLCLDVHLMINDPDRYVKEYAQAGANILTVHLEALHDVERSLRTIRSYGVKAGLTIKPGTPVSALEPYLEEADMFLMMTVEPGFGGQTLIPSCLEKVTKLRELLRKKGLETDVEVDGGITKDNVRDVIAAGANVIVAGSAVFGVDTAQNAQKFMQLLRD
ncbi:MAG: ribulose-phosphate 3-epimerase [Lachnospiraceae bacterium]|jgi:ribulose-phosphate 3-epimerase|nr:ribulose-phosphate 3-epimerase [Lachnospiraceae bacterium]